MGRWIVDNRVRYRREVFVAVGEALVLLGGRRLLASPWLERMGSTKACLLCREGPGWIHAGSDVAPFSCSICCGSPCYHHRQDTGGAICRNDEVIYNSPRLSFDARHAKRGPRGLGRIAGRAFHRSAARRSIAGRDGLDAVARTRDPDQECGGRLTMPGLIAYAIVRRRFLTGLADWRAWLSFAGAAAVVAGWFMLRERLSPGYLAAVWSYDVAGPMLSVLEGHRGGPAFCAWVLLRGFEPAMLLSPTLSAMPWDADPRRWRLAFWRAWRLCRAWPSTVSLPPSSIGTYAAPIVRGGRSAAVCAKTASR
jgi:hypothetical protein